MYWIHFLFIGTSHSTSERKIYHNDIECQDEHESCGLTKPFPHMLGMKPSPGVVRQRPQHLCHEQAALQRTRSLRKSGCKDCKDESLGLLSGGILILRWFNWHWTHAFCYLLMKPHSMDWERNIAVALSRYLQNRGDFGVCRRDVLMGCILQSLDTFAVIKMKGNPNLCLFCWEWVIGFPLLGQY